MIKVKITADINCPREEVFELLTDISGYSGWMPQTGLFRKSEKTSPGPPQLGTTFNDRTLAGKLKGEIYEFEKPRKVSFRQKLRWLGIPVMESRPRYILESTGKGTRVFHEGELYLFGIFRLIHSRARKLARSERKRTVHALKKAAEAGIEG